MSEYVKNKARQIRAPQKKYVPEYERLSKEPRVEKLDKQVFAYPQSRRTMKPFVSISSGERPAIPRQVRVYSGSNKDHEWTDSLSHPQNPTLIDPLERATQEFEDKKIFIPSTVAPKYMDADEWDLKKSNEQPYNAPVEKNTNDVAPGDYIVMYESKILFIGNINDAENFVWQMAAGTNEEEPVDINQVMVLKRLPIKIGAAFIE